MMVRLETERIPGPDGSLWIETTLPGRAKRGTGIISHELYVGRLVWNRQRYIKDPRTGRRVSRMNAESLDLVHAKVYGHRLEGAGIDLFSHGRRQCRDDHLSL